MSDSMFEERRDIARQIQSKIEGISDDDARVLADMVIKFGEDINDLMMRTLTSFSPLMQGLEASMIAPLCLADASIQVGFGWKQSTGETIKELRGMAQAARAERDSGGSFVTAMLERLAKLREGKE